ncbi:SHOCT domain-containing protein [Actinokineospora bangkokensis]|uniref:SHOCT domain-containing protein n=1 Tax=Actinokineospora bangkokensis TaxID=1193682 RepID=A0A1Q9LLD1_9PSEU|nr:SHOCT domain-containing protein [Actinokineospora bangkokensis]OLR92803.1 hypothetical protein BJP25_19430 [Actinokineospora bangkokensis]
MSWHDELRWLDDELAAGRISAEEYRARRARLTPPGAAAGQAVGGPQEVPGVPPQVSARGYDAAHQGPEVFSDKGAGIGSRVGVIALVVVLVGLAVGAWLLFRPMDGPDPAAGPQQAGVLAELPGQAQDMADIATFDQVAEVDYLTEQEIQVYRDNGAGGSRIALSTDDGVRVVVLVVDVRDAAAAVGARDGLEALQRDFGLTQVTGPPGVVVSANQGATGGPLTRGHYAAGNRVVRVQAQGQDGAAAQRVFDSVLAAQQQRLPADG